MKCSLFLEHKTRHSATEIVQHCFDQNHVPSHANNVREKTISTSLQRSDLHPLSFKFMGYKTCKTYIFISKQVINPIELHLA